MGRIVYEARKTPRNVPGNPLSRLIVNLHVDTDSYELGSGMGIRTGKRTKANRKANRTYPIEPSGNIDALVENRILLMETIMSGYLPPWVSLFMTAYANSKNVRLSCMAANIDRETFDIYNEHSELFQQRFDRARKDAIDLLDAKGWQAAMSGKDPGMLKFYLAAHRPEEYRERAVEAGTPTDELNRGKYDEVVLEWANGTPVIDSTSRVIEQENHALNAPSTEPQAP